MLSEAPAVRDALRRLVADAVAAHPNVDASDERVRRDTRELCAQAHEADVPVERLLAALKDEWRALPDAAGLPYRDARVALSALVTRCIRDFYAAERGA